jgi:hypothetical protein
VKTYFKGIQAAINDYLEDNPKANLNSLWNHLKGLKPDNRTIYEGFHVYVDGEYIYQGSKDKVKKESLYPYIKRFKS